MAAVTRERHRGLVLLGLAGLLVCTVLSSLALGPLSIPLAHTLDITASLIGLGSTTAPAYELATIEAIRLPRTLTALVTGAALAGGGAVLQGLTRNPLVEPALIGISSGAALGAALAIVMGLAGWLLPPTAFVGGLLAAVAVFQLARVDGRMSAATLLLGGVAINALTAALLGLMIYAADDQQLRTLTFWMFGSLARTDGAALQWMVPVVLGCCVMMWREHRALDALALGDRVAGHLGVSADRVRGRLLAVTVLAVGVVVSHTGVIAFVGLVVPHLVRLLLGAHHRHVILASLLLGAGLTAAADTTARLLVAPAELPIGVVTSLVGAPVFIALLVWRRRDHAQAPV